MLGIYSNSYCKACAYTFEPNVWSAKLLAVVMVVSDIEVNERIAVLLT